jgi:site-specific DNA-methyltransferase (adenine-specific)/adenine-specific DNA-methyltransferase
LIPRTDEQDKRYKNPDNDPRGPWKTSDLSARNFYSEGTYPITCPNGRIIPGPPRGRYWSVSKEKFQSLKEDNRIWWGKNGNSVPQVKRFLKDVKKGSVPQTLWTYNEVGHTQEAKKELVGICDFEDSASVFITPKPTRLIRRILEVATDKDSLVLDSFAGSGTTGHAVLGLNKSDGGNRRFILVEMDKTVCQNVAAQRLTRAVEGYERISGEKAHKIEPLGGGFRFCELGRPLFDETGNIAEWVSFSDLAAHVFFTETGMPISGPATGETPLLGIHAGSAVYLLFNGVLGDKRPEGGNMLSRAVLSSLPAHSGPKVIYGEGCLLSAQRLGREGVVFKQVPYGIKVS